MRRYARHFVAIVLSAGLSHAQTDNPATRIEVSHISGNVYMLTKSRPITYRGQSIQWRGNVYASVGPDGILLVDNGLEHLADSIQASLRSIGHGAIRTIVNTHWHQDHTGANRVLGAGIPIIAHENTRKEMMNGESYPNGYTISAAPMEALPNITFTDSLSLHFNGEEITLQYFPHGHTEGDIVVYFTGSNVLYMGDTYNGHFFPRIVGDVQAYAENYRRLIHRLPQDVRILSGHRPPASLEDMKVFQSMLSETISVVQKQMEAGQTLDAIKGHGLPEAWRSWGRGNVINALTAEEWIEVVYHSLSNHSIREK
jgi:cyclase